MPTVMAYGWTFRSRFRTSAFGLRSDLPIKRIKEAVAEIKKATWCCGAGVLRGEQRRSNDWLGVRFQVESNLAVTS